jgi:hypothetical protein
VFKIITTTLLFIALIAQNFNRTIIVTSYYTNTDAYAKNCINKAKPKLLCNGKCQMAKQLQEEEQKDQQNAERKIVKEEVLSSKSFFTVLVFTIPISIKQYCNWQCKDTVDIPASVFHPPSSVA